MTTVPLEHWLLVAGILFAIGAIGVLARRNALVMFMSIEIMLNAVNLTLVAFSRFRGDEAGHVMAFFIIAVAAAEAAVGLAIVLEVFRHHRSVHADEVRALRH